MGPTPVILQTRQKVPVARFHVTDNPTRNPSRAAGDGVEPIPEAPASGGQGVAGRAVRIWTIAERRTVLAIRRP